MKERLGDMMLDLIVRLPDRCVPAAVMNWAERYLARRTAAVQSQIIKAKWNKVKADEQMQHLKKKTSQED